MVAEIIFVLFICSSCFFGYTFFNKNFEDYLPVTFSGIAFVLFIFGVFGKLRLGVYFLFILFPALLIISGIKIYKDKNAKERLLGFFSSGFFIFITLTVYFTYTLYGKLYDGNDEFSHWGDVVKAMTIYDRFSTDSIMNSMFPNYPPGMSLVLYFMEEINIVLLKGGYIEYISIIASSMFTVSFVIPSFKFMKRKAVDILAAVILIIFIPQFMFFSAYTYLFIDGFIGITFGGALMQILFTKEKDVLYDLNICSAAFILTIAKDAGVLFAVLILLAYVLDRAFAADYINHKNDKIEEKFKKIAVIARIILCPVLSIVPAKILWNYCITRDGANKVFASKYNLADYFNVISGNVNSDNAYRKESFDNFMKAIFSGATMDEFSGVRISYVALIILFSLAVVLLIVYQEKTERVHRNTGIVVAVIAILSMIIYTWGLQITYMYNFSVDDAVILTSFWRYMNIGYVGIWLDIFILLVYTFYDKGKWKYISYLAVIIAILLTNPLKFHAKVISRQFVREAAEYRKDIDALADVIIDTVSADAAIYYITQEGSDYNFYTMRTAARPCRIMNHGGWSLGLPYYEDDRYTVNKSSDEFMDELINGYDYLAIHIVNDGFIQLYGDLFEDGNVKADSIYVVDKDKRSLRFVAGID